MPTHCVRVAKPALTRSESAPASDSSVIIVHCRMSGAKMEVIDVMAAAVSTDRHHHDFQSSRFRAFFNKAEMIRFSPLPEGEVGMGALRAHIPGEGLRSLLYGGFPLTRIAQARSDLSPPRRGDRRSPIHCRHPRA